MLKESILTQCDRQLIHDVNRYGVRDILKRYRGRMTYLGSGVNASAYLLPSGNVLRLEEEANEDGWHEWMKHVVLKDTTDMTARVGYFSLFADPANGAQRCVSIQERLYRINTSMPAFRDMCGIGETVAAIAKSRNPLERWNEACKGYKNLEHFFPQAAVEDFSKIVKESDLDLNDCHMGNIMHRREGDRLILTDPVN